MKTFKPYYCLPVLGALAMSSCILPEIPFPPPLPFVNVGNSNPYPNNNGGYYYLHQGRYYNGGRYENGNYYYRGQNYNGRYYNNGRYYYGGSHEYHDGSWQRPNRVYSY
ncbi:MAG: hypothetical protein WCS65_01575 [Verrucomicrobiae bacterium]